MRHLILILTALMITACNESGGGAQTADATAPIDGLLPSDPGDPNQIVAPPQNVTLTYYTMTRTIAPSTSNPGLTFTATASCFEYESRQFCWDDGIHTIPAGPYQDNYFGLQNHVSTGSPQSCKLSCNSSWMQSIREVTNRRNLTLIVLGGTLGQEVDHILANGTMAQTSCTLEDDELTCGNMVIDVGQ